VLVITTGDADKNRLFFSEHKITGPVLLQKDSEVATAYRANGTPTGYLINAEGRTASELAVGAEALLELAEGKAEDRKQKAETNESGPGPGETVAGNGDARANRFRERSLAGSKIARNGLKAGTPAPQFCLPRLDGGELALEDLRGSRVLLVFSDPHCGPCDALAPQLEQWHRDHSELRVVMISRGEPKANRAKVKEHGLTFPVVLQQHWEISRRYAMFATPIAYLIDEAGVITHDVAVGEDAILKVLSEKLCERSTV
jgi:peroxiredoxin